MKATPHRANRCKSPSLALLIVFGALPAGCGVTFDTPFHGTFADTGPDVIPRYFHRASLLSDGRVMVSGGLTATVLPPALIPLDTIAFYDPASGQFSTASDASVADKAVQKKDGISAKPVPLKLHIARSSHTQTTLHDGRVLITGGDTRADNLQPRMPTASTEIFDPVAGTITIGPPMSEPRAFHTATLLDDGRVVVVGGSTLQVFDPGMNRWSSAVPLAMSRVRHMAVLLDDRVLVMGGTSFGDSIELVDPIAMSTRLLNARLTTGVFDSAAVRLADGTVLIVGGQRAGSGETVNDTQIFNPADETIHPLDPPPGVERGFGDHQLIRVDPYVLAFGGERQIVKSDTELQQALIFDSRTLKWAGSTQMIHRHDDFAAVVLKTGQILLISGGKGYLGVEFPTSNAELLTISPEILP